MARELVLIPRVKYECLIQQLNNDKSKKSEFKECEENINNDMQDMTYNETKTSDSYHSSNKLINLPVGEISPAQLEPKQLTNVYNAIRSNIAVTERSGGKMKRKYVKRAAKDPSSEKVINQGIPSDRRARKKTPNSEPSMQLGGKMKERRYVNQSFSTFMQNKPNTHRWVPYKI